LSWEDLAELERQQDELREKLDALNYEWNERDSISVAIKKARTLAECHLDSIVLSHLLRMHLLNLYYLTGTTTGTAGQNSKEPSAIST